MGYTHYWDRKADLSSGWADFLKDVKTFIANLPYHIQTETGYQQLILAGPHGTGKPVFTSVKIAFNGKGDQAFETFDFPRKLPLSERSPSRDMPEGYFFSFCKTEYRPYDIVVTGVLLLARKHFRDRVKIASDGDINGSDWEPARTLLQKLRLV